MRRVAVVLLFMVSSAWAVDADAQGRRRAVQQPKGCPAMTAGANVFFTFIGTLSGCTAASEWVCFPGEVMLFNASSFGYRFNCSPHTFRWNFGDGTVDSGASVSKVFVAHGLYNVSLTITNERQSVVVTQPLPVGGVSY